MHKYADLILSCPRTIIKTQIIFDPTPPYNIDYYPFPWRWIILCKLPFLKAAKMIECAEDSSCSCQIKCVQHKSSCLSFFDRVFDWGFWQSFLTGFFWQTPQQLRVWERAHGGHWSHNWLNMSTKHIFLFHSTKYDMAIATSSMCQQNRTSSQSRTSWIDIDYAVPLSLVSANIEARFVGCCTPLCFQRL